MSQFLLQQLLEKLVLEHHLVLVSLGVFFPFFFFFSNTAFKPKALEGTIFFVSNPVPQCIYEQVALIKTVSRFWEYGGVDCTKCLKKNCKHCTGLVLC